MYTVHKFYTPLISPVHCLPSLASWQPGWHEHSTPLSVSRQVCEQPPLKTSHPVLTSAQIKVSTKSLNKWCTVFLVGYTYLCMIFYLQLIRNHVCNGTRKNLGYLCTCADILLYRVHRIRLRLTENKCFIKSQWGIDEETIKPMHDFLS